MNKPHQGGPERSLEREKTPLSTIFQQYGQLAVLRGEVGDILPDAVLAADKDGTTNEKGEKMHVFELELKGANVPSVMREKEIVSLRLYYVPEVILDGEPDAETVRIELQDLDSVTKVITLRRGRDGDVRAAASLEFDSRRHQAAESGLSLKERQWIVDSLLADDDSKELLHRDDKVGVYARKIINMMEGEGGIDVDDADMLAMALPEIEVATRRKL